LGLWDFEPEKVHEGEFDATHALPGTDEKLAVLSERLRMGLPLWHPRDVQSFEDQHAETPEQGERSLAAGGRRKTAVFR
jgi:hypothetical protein